MTTNYATMAHDTAAPEAVAALCSVTDRARAENLALVAAISDAADIAQIADHIKGMVAVTMGHLSVNASATTRANAEQWQVWALGVAGGVEQGVPAVA